MTAKNLSTLSHEFIDAWGNTATNLVEAGRAGGERIGNALARRYDSALRATADRLSEETVANARNARKVLGHYFRQGLAFTAGGTRSAIDASVRFAGLGVDGAAAGASRFKDRTGSPALDNLAAAMAPAALAVRRVATRVEDVSGVIASRAAGARRASARKAR